MFSKTLLCLSLGIGQAALAMDSLYTFDFNQLNAAKEAVQTTCSGQEAENFLSLVPQAIRSTLSDDFIERLKLEKVRSYGYTFRQKGTLPLSGAKSMEEIDRIIFAYYSNPENLDQPELASQRMREYFTNIQSVTEKAIEKIKDSVLTYNDFIAKRGPIRDWKFKDFMDHLLGIPQTHGIQPTEVGEDVFQTLKHTGFLRTEIPSLNAFSYDPTSPIRHFMATNPEISTLVLGCGHHLHSDITVDLGQPDESYCGMCNLTQHHSGEFTIALSASDIPDVVADMHDERAWTMLKSKEGGWKRISDHSWSESLRQESTLKHIYESLNEDGIFEIWDIHPLEEIMAKLGPIGFQFISQDDEKRLMFFVK